MIHSVEEPPPPSQTACPMKAGITSRKVKFAPARVAAALITLYSWSAVSFSLVSSLGLKKVNALQSSPLNRCG